MSFLRRSALLSGCVAGLITGYAFAQDKSSPLHEAMSKGMQQMQSMQMTGDVDKDFAMMMRHHHQSGIEMAQIELREGKDPQMKKQAQKIIDGQKKEIAEFDRWMQAKGAAQGRPASGSTTGAGESGHGHDATHK